MSSCCACQKEPGDKCRTTITSQDLAELLYVQGLDVNLCKKFAPIADLFQFRDCAGNIIAANTQIVTCVEFAARLCATLSALADGGTVVLGVTEVVGADCQTYVIPETPLVATDTSTIDFTTSGPFGHNITAVVRVSADAGNVITIRPDGLYAPSACDQIDTFPAGAPVVLDVTPVLGADCLTHTVPETPFVALDTNTIDHTNFGPYGHTLSSQVKISAISGNIISAQGDGIYAPATTVAVQDSSCIDLSIVGPPGAQVISANAIISPNAGNQVQCLANGLFVPPDAAETPITVIDTPCINLTASGTANHTVQADLVVSPAPGNAAQCTAQGLFVPAETVVSVVAVDTPCIDITVTEAPSGQFNVSAVPVISPDIGNGLTCTPNGLYATSTTPLTVLDTQCINLTLVGDQLSADPVLADTYPSFPAGCNGLQCTPTGLAAPPDSAGSTATVVGQQLSDTLVNEGEANSQVDTTINIVNPSNCRSAMLRITHRTSEVNTVGVVGTSGSFDIGVQAVHMFNLPGVQVTGFFVLTTMEIKHVNIANDMVMGPDYRAADISFDFIVPPGFVGSYTGRSQYIVVQATTPIENITLQPTVLHYSLTTI